MPHAPGKVINSRYRIVKLLGWGGFGAVYRAWDINLEAPCAVKENFDTSEEVARQFKREASLLYQLHHPNLPKVTDHFSTPGQGQFLVMEYIEGENLEEMLERAGGPLPETQVLPWIEQVLGALEYLHSQSPPIIHRDIKPANIRITPQGKAMLVDFGIAKVYDPSMETTQGARAVTPGFSPLEQYGRGLTDQRTDIYALGATLYNLLSGHQPPESVQRVVSDQLVSVERLNPNLKPETAAAIGRALQVDPAMRFQSATEFKLALKPSPVPSAPAAGGESPGNGEPAPTVVTVAPGRTKFSVPDQADPAQPVSVKAPRAVPWGWIGGVSVFALLVIIGLVVLFGILSPGGRAEGDATRTALVGISLSATVMPTSPVPLTPTLLSTAELPSLTGTPSDTGVPSATSTLKAGATQVSDIDGMVMVYIPEGEFLMGSADSVQVAQADEKPQHRLDLDDYWIDLTEVTNAMFSQFTKTTGYRTEAEITGWGWIYDLVSEERMVTDGADWNHPRGLMSSISGFESHPVVQVSWNDAVAYCRWAGRRLPSEAEWEKAARGLDDRVYPWGDQGPAGDLVNFADENLDISWADRTVADGYQFTAPVGNYLAGASPYVALDMAGNVWEWTMDWYLVSFYAASPFENPAGPGTGTYRVVRGGSWFSNENDLRVTNRGRREPKDMYSNVGFRCARSVSTLAAETLEPTDIDLVAFTPTPTITPTPTATKKSRTEKERPKKEPGGGGNGGEPPY